MDRILCAVPTGPSLEKWSGTRKRQINETILLYLLWRVSGFVCVCVFVHIILSPTVLTGQPATILMRDSSRTYKDVCKLNKSLESTTSNYRVDSNDRTYSSKENKNDSDTLKLNCHNNKPRKPRQWWHTIPVFSVHFFLFLGEIATKWMRTTTTLAHDAKWHTDAKCMYVPKALVHLPDRAAINTNYLCVCVCVCVSGG